MTDVFYVFICTRSSAGRCGTGNLVTVPAVHVDWPTAKVAQRTGPDTAYGAQSTDGSLHVTWKLPGCYNGVTRSCLSDSHYGPDRLIGTCDA